jgi:hypothetical protein
MCGQNMNDPILDNSVDTPVGTAIKLKEASIILRLGTMPGKEALDSMCD